MSGWRPELTATAAETEALHSRAADRSAARCARACPAPGRILARARPHPDRRGPARDPVLAGRHVPAGRADRAAGGHRPDLAAGRAGARRSRWRGWASSATYRLYEGQSAAIARKSFDEVSTLFNALLAGSLALLVVGQGLKKGFDIFVYSPLEALFFLSLAVVAVPTLRGVVRTWAAPEHDAPAAHADRRRRRHRAPARAQDRDAPRVRPRARRLRRRRSPARTCSARPPS